MMKKVSIVLALAMVFAMVLAACAPTATPTAAPAATDPVAPKVKKVGFSTPTAASGFMAMVAGELEKAFKAAGYEWNISVADGDSKKQIDGIENFITLKVDVLVVMAVDPTALKDVLQKAHDQGIKIINFTTDPGVGDVYMGSDEYVVGTTVAEVASEWIDTAFPTAADGSVKVAIMEFRDTPEAAKRSDGLATIASNKKVTIVKVVQVGNTAPDAQAAAENLLLTNPDVNVVLTYNSSMSLGVNAYAMTPGSAIQDKAKFGVFGADVTEEVAAAIRASTKDESVLRGVTQLGGNIMEAFAKIVTFSDQLLAGEQVPARDLAIILKVNTANIEEVIKQQYPNLK